MRTSRRRREAQDALGELIALIKAGKRVCLLCYERDPNQCHRSRIAALVKKLEELGIGRPSTYASIISVLQERDYVELDKKRFIAADRGRIVTAFLSSFFKRYVEYDFTATT